MEREKNDVFGVLSLIETLGIYNKFFELSSTGYDVPSSLWEFEILLIEPCDIKPIYLSHRIQFSFLDL